MSYVAQILTSFLKPYADPNLGKLQTASLISITLSHFYGIMLISKLDGSPREETTAQSVLFAVGNLFVLLLPILADVGGRIGEEKNKTKLARVKADANKKSKGSKIVPEKTSAMNMQEITIQEGQGSGAAAVTPRQEDQPCTSATTPNHPSE